ncbi:MAG TPA: SDR family oxidoreductase [Chitinophaga sp.]|uniref:SDR family oxidoreductase n=1 Tax=Chitinophaga sp. TaxID=1869181 RepID=UPI002BB2A990|nr:SDR family oxidoreductase [Chitinophaga sp.]HVI48666.1 SDR family oxidoreductase [Chitinophaga sp.]
MIAITGANGNLGKATLSFLLKKTNPADIIAIVRNPEKMQDLVHTGIKIRIADYNDHVLLNEALQGVDTVLQISSSSAGEQATQEEHNVVKAAKQQGVKHIVYTSTLDPHDGSYFMAAHTCLHTENAIKESGAAYTIFRNSMYMETVPLFIGSAMEDGNVQYPGSDGKVSFASRIDIAEALSNVLVSDAHNNRTYNITGSKAYSFGDIAGLLKTAMRMPSSSYANIPLDAYREALASYEMPEGEIEFYLSMANSIRSNEFARTDDALEQILQRKRLSLEEYLGNI